MKEADMSKGLRNVDYESKKKRQNTKPTEEEDEEEEAPGTDLMDIIMRIVMASLIVLASLLVLALIILILLRIIRWAKWRLAFRDKDPKKGVRALYQYGREKKWPLSDKAEEIGDRASYSTSEIGEADRENMRKELKLAKDRAKAERTEKRKTEVQKEKDEEGNEKKDE